MDLWTAIVAIVALGISFATVSQIIQLKYAKVKNQAQEFSKDSVARLAKIEERMSNLETVVLKQEKERKFDSL